MVQNSNNKRPPKPRLRLPFTDKKRDMGEWAYDHRAGLCSMIIAYLLIAIAFVSAKIFVGSEPHTQGFYIDLEDIAALEEHRDELQQELLEQQQFNWESVSNRTSNDNSLDQRVVDDRNTNVSALNDNASRAQEEMDANRQAYEAALAQIEEQRKQTKEQTKEQSTERRDIKREGNVTVSYSFDNPVRHAQELIVPAYQCQGGGKVVVAVQLDNSGKVLAARVLSGGDQCMQQGATRAAQSSRFNASADAPSPHEGTITYIFIPQ